jgi:two-component system, chemotaxis family, chemotaxis protein CheY
VACGDSGITGLWLVVEDDDDDFFLFCRACSRALEPQPILHREKDGVAAKTFLRNNPGAPRLIVSDLKMPGMNGLKLLQWVRSQAALSKVPFIMLSNSNDEQDVTAARAYGVDDYQVKPFDLRDYRELVQGLATGRVTHGPVTGRAARDDTTPRSGALIP